MVKPTSAAAATARLASRAMSEIELSVVIPVYRGARTLPRVLEPLRSQVAGHEREVVVVESSADGYASEIATRWPWVRVIARDQRTPAGLARNIGAGAAQGRALAFLDADAVPAPAWLDELERARGPGIAMVGGAILNGFPGNRWANAAHILEFLDWVPPRADAISHAASCNMLVERSAFESVGGFPSDVWTAEDTILSFAFGQDGRLAFAPDACVHHLNCTTLQGLRSDQYKHGVGFREVCERLDFPGSLIVREHHLLLALAYRSAALYVRLKTHPAEYRRARRLSPLLAVGLAAWGRGLAAGQRPVDSRRRVPEYAT